MPTRMRAAARTTAQEATPPSRHRASTMKVTVQDRYGSADVLQIKEVAMPIPADDEVLVRVHAAGLNHADTALMRGEPLILRLAYGLRRPKVRVRGLDLAGVVEAIGSKVTTFSPGDEVYAQIETGSFAEYAVVPERALAPKPANLSFTVVGTFAPSAFGLSEREARHFGDDAVGRALDRLYDSDRAGLLTDIVVAAANEFGVSLDELHNDSSAT